MVPFSFWLGVFVTVFIAVLYIVKKKLDPLLDYILYEWFFLIIGLCALGVGYILFIYTGKNKDASIDNGEFFVSGIYTGVGMILILYDIYRHWKGVDK